MPLPSWSNIAAVERIAQHGPTGRPAVHGVEHRFDSLLLAERTASGHGQWLLVELIKEVLDHRQHVITLRPEPALAFPHTT